MKSIDYYFLLYITSIYLLDHEGRKRLHRVLHETISLLERDNDVLFKDMLEDFKIQLAERQKRRKQKRSK